MRSAALVRAGAGSADGVPEAAGEASVGAASVGLPEHAIMMRKTEEDMDAVPS